MTVKVGINGFGRDWPSGFEGHSGLLSRCIGSRCLQ